jgi:peroxiredoxin Q/BCP
MMDLKVGDKIPNFRATDTNGNDFDSQSIVGHQPLVIYFYPKDNTPGCTAQACGFRDQYQDFKDLGAEVIGVSSDSVASHQEFTQHYKLPFLLLSDPNKTIKKLFGVHSKMLGLIPGRVTYVADKNGIIQLIFDGIIATRHMREALETVKRLVS